MTTHLLVVANPRSGRGRSRKKADSFIGIATSRGYTCTLISVLGEKTMLDSISQALSEGTYDGLIAVGGDGLLHTLLPVIKEFNIPFTVIAGGTGNDFAREIGTKGQTHRQILDSVQSEPVALDSFAISARGQKHHAVQVLSLGFDALVNERANSLKYVKGKAKYVFALLRELSVFKPIHFTIELDGRVFEREAMLIAIANGPSYGGGMLISPGADNADGVLDLVIVNKVSIPQLLRVFPKVYRGKHITHPAVEMLRGKRIHIEADAKAFADGEFVANLPISVDVEPGSLRVWK